MKSILPIHLALGLSLSFALACDVVPGPDYPTGATLKISSATAYATTSGKWKVDYTTVGLKLAPAGTCGGDTGCGHVLVFVDGFSCNQGDLKFYAADSSGTSVDVDLNRCKSGAAGEHLITLELVRDDGSPVLNSANSTVFDRVKVKPAS